MKKLNVTLFIIVLLFGFNSYSQDKNVEKRQLEQVLTQVGYDRTSPAIVKLVADGGKKIGGGVILGSHADGIGFILTTYSMIAGREKVAIILKNHPDALLGKVVDKWIDFDLDLAVVAVRNFPPEQPVIKIIEPNSAEVGDIYTIIAHSDEGDWVPVPAELSNIDDTSLIMGVNKRSGFGGTPILDRDGSMVALSTGDETIKTSKRPLVSGIKSNVLKPILNEWFQPIKLETKWREKGFILPTWALAVGGGVMGGTVATILAIGGDSDGGSSGLPVAPPPPPPGQ